MRRVGSPAALPRAEPDAAGQSQASGSFDLTPLPEKRPLTGGTVSGPPKYSNGEHVPLTVRPFPTLCAPAAWRRGASSTRLQRSVGAFVSTIVSPRLIASSAFVMHRCRRRLPLRSWIRPSACTAPPGGGRSTSPSEERRGQRCRQGIPWWRKACCRSRRASRVLHRHRHVDERAGAVRNGGVGRLERAVVVRATARRHRIVDRRRGQRSVGYVARRSAEVRRRLPCGDAGDRNRSPPVWKHGPIESDGPLVAGSPSFVRAKPWSSHVQPVRASSTGSSRRFRSGSPGGAGSALRCRSSSRRRSRRRDRRQQHARA